MMDIPINEEEPIIVLKVNLTGKTGEYTIDMALDTGATYVMIPWCVAEHLGYEPAVSPERINITTASTTVKVPLITVGAIGIGDMTVKNIKVVVHDLPHKSRVDGLLGLSYLRNFDVFLKFKSNKLTIL